MISTELYGYDLDFHSMLDTIRSHFLGLKNLIKAHFGISLLFSTATNTHTSTCTQLIFSAFCFSPLLPHDPPTLSNSTNPLLSSHNHYLPSPCSVIFLFTSPILPSIPCPCFIISPIDIHVLPTSLPFSFPRPLLFLSFSPSQDDV